jgi:hypothetical protein
MGGAELSMGKTVKLVALIENLRAAVCKEAESPRFHHEHGPHFRAAHREYLTDPVQSLAAQWAARALKFHGLFLS